MTKKVRYVVNDLRMERVRTAADADHSVTSQSAGGTVSLDIAEPRVASTAVLCW